MGTFDDRRPFTRADAVAVGVSPGILRSSRYRRLFRDVWVRAAVPDTHELRGEGALLVHPPTAWASHRSTAHLLGLPVDAPSRVELAVRATATGAVGRGCRCGCAPPRPARAPGAGCGSRPAPP